MTDSSSFNHYYEHHSTGCSIAREMSLVSKPLALFLRLITEICHNFQSNKATFPGCFSICDFLLPVNFSSRSKLIQANCHANWCVAHHCTGKLPCFKFFIVKSSQVIICASSDQQRLAALRPFTLWHTVKNHALPIQILRLTNEVYLIYQEPLDVIFLNLSYQTWDLSKILHRRIIRPKILHPYFHWISETVLMIKTPKKSVNMKTFTPLAKNLHCRRQWRHWQIPHYN